MHVDVASVDLGIAVFVLLAAGAVVRFALLVPALGLRRSEATADGRNIVRWAEWSQVSAITVFLVAQLNGITEVTSLVPIYAITATAALLLALQERSGGGEAGRRLGAVAAVIGIVPWGRDRVRPGRGDPHERCAHGDGPHHHRRDARDRGRRVGFVWRAGHRSVTASAVADEVTYLGLALLGTGTFAWLAVGGIVLPSAL